MSLDPVKDAWEEYAIHMKTVNEAFEQIQACQSIIITALHDLGDNVREARESFVRLPGASEN
jgi:hypothetical protein